MSSLIIAGSRHICKYRAFYEFFKWMESHEIFKLPSVLISGECPTGPDQVPHLFKAASDETTQRFLRVESFEPNWEEFGNRAGPIRNRKMAERGDKLLLIWDGKSRGSRDMKKQMEKLGKPVFEIILDIPAPKK